MLYSTCLSQLEFDKLEVRNYRYFVMFVYLLKILF